MELRCAYDSATRGGDAPDGRRSRRRSIGCRRPRGRGEVRLYDRLFSVEDPERAVDGGGFLDHPQPESLEVLKSARRSRVWRRRRRRRGSSSSVLTFCLDADSTPGARLVQPGPSRCETPGRGSNRNSHRRTWNITSLNTISSRARSRFEYIEEFFGEFPRKKTATEIVRRLGGRRHLILLANAPLPDDPGTVVPVSFKVAHEITIAETEPKLVDLVARLDSFVAFDGRRVLYTWIGGTRRDWRGQGSSARSPSSRSSGRSSRASTRSWSRPRTSSTTCAARSTTCGSRSASTSATSRQRRVEGLSEQEAPARDVWSSTGARRPSCRRRPSGATALSDPAPSAADMYSALNRSGRSAGSCNVLGPVLRPEAEEHDPVPGSCRSRRRPPVPPSVLPP